MSFTTAVPPPNGRISELVALITNAAKAIESHYTKSSISFVPSLDDLTPHPLDATISPPELRNAVQLLEGACAQLSATVARPDHTILNRAMQTYEPSCLNVVTTFKIPDILKESPTGMHITELGQKAGVNPEKLGRIMRLLASKHIFREVALECFANNRLSLQLVSANPLTSMVLHLTDENNKATALLTEVLADHEWGDSLAVERSPWNKSTGYQGTLFQYFEGATPEAAKQGARFGLGMRGWNHATQAAAVLNDFPWGDLPSGTKVCDVGSGVGNIAMELLKAYPNLILKLQDLPDRIHQAETQVWPKDYPSAIAEKRIEFEAMDFFVGAPKGFDIYYLKNIIHNWPDKECIQILRNIRAVMKPGGRVLLRALHLLRDQLQILTKNVDDYVLQHASRTTESNPNSAFAEAPEPVLPNYGVGRIRQYNLDLCVMVLLNSRERTLEEFIDMAKTSGLQFVKLWHTGEMGVVELKAL